jgi:hypothetical protein
MNGIPITITHRAVFIPHDGESKRHCRTDISRIHAEIGSDQLANAMRKQFLTFAARHGVTVKDATLLLMNGEGL